MRFFLLILVVLFYPWQAFATCGGVYQVTIWELDENSDVIFISEPISSEEKRKFHNIIQFKDQNISLKVAKVLKGAVKVGEDVDLKYRAINRSTSIPAGGAFGFIRRDNLVAATYHESEEVKELVSIRLPRGGCYDVTFTPSNLESYFLSQTLLFPTIQQFILHHWYKHIQPEISESLLFAYQEGYLRVAAYIVFFIFVLLFMKMLVRITYKLIELLERE